MPGTPITDRQVARYMDARNDGKTQAQAAASADISERSGRGIERDGRPARTHERTWRTRVDPFALIWDSEIVPSLARDERLRALTLFVDLQRRHPGRFPDGQRRTFERRVREWKRRHGTAPVVCFPQDHPPGWQGLVDFTVANELGVTIADRPLPHRLGHFRLACSGFASALVILGGESYPALAQTVAKALAALGGAPQTLRTDSLSAAFKNLTQFNDLTRRYEALCAHYHMRATRNTLGVSHENGSIESPNGHLKDRLDQALRLRASRDFATLDAYRAWVDALIADSNARRADAIATERAVLTELPRFAPVIWNDATGVVSTFSMIRVLGVGYTVPAWLKGCQLAVRIFDDRLEFLRRSEAVWSCRRVHDGASRSVDYRCVIDSLVRKPGAFARLVYRDDLHPRPEFRGAWEALSAKLSESAACRAYVRLLHLAHAHACESALAARLADDAAAGRCPEVESHYAALARPTAAPAPIVRIAAPDLASYDSLIASSWKNDTQTQEKIA